MYKHNRSGLSVAQPALNPEESFPESGRIPPELEHLSYREVVVSPCRIFYKFDGKCVHILFIMRAERDLRNFLISNQ
ncbi:type II toxin-antitoxin system RelE/ParE family toxin [Vibrio tapetis]|uniref:Plasmid stabilization system protein n=1 Tax=Vibrio tapetis subsp. tapetis TaxID=1671868 RepID=A0A2N8ZJZ1_9VIBR|nr:type II toxin-antitoxin system RelE/ParE family toxin [Vibrio tapetis]SON52224.1 protein of unknown function [Vibrio tapetis subsp. tapetis]